MWAASSASRMPCNSAPRTVISLSLPRYYAFFLFSCGECIAADRFEFRPEPSVYMIVLRLLCVIHLLCSASAFSAEVAMMTLALPYPDGQAKGLMLSICGWFLAKVVVCLFLPT